MYNVGNFANLFDDFTPPVFDALFDVEKLTHVDVGGLTQTIAITVLLLRNHLFFLFIRPS